MESDRELLRQYAETGSEAAFTEVVRRHTDLVYSAALRMVAGDAHLAQEVAQSVFTSLARKAGKLSRHANLLGWLHTTTRYAASVAVRGERRRRTHEQEASSMQNHSTTAELDWSHLGPVLDEAVGRLREADREAVLLRFFQGKTHREVAAELGLNEVLARKRIDRALDKLRSDLSRRGVTVSATLLAASITTNSVQAAPVGLATSLGSVSLMQAAHSGVVGGLFKGITMAMKAKAGLTAATIIVFCAVPAVIYYEHLKLSVSQNSGLIEQNSNRQSEIATHDNQKPPGVKIVITNFNLTVQGRQLLNLTDGEVSNVQQILSNLKDKIQTYERGALAEIPLAKVTDPNLVNFLRNNVGNQSAYYIPAMSDTERTALQNWFSNNIIGVIGTDRSEPLLTQAADIGTYWLKPGVSIDFAFSDSASDDEKSIVSSWQISFHDGLHSLVGSGRQDYKDAVPPEYAGVFKGVRDGPRKPDLSRSPQDKKIQRNLDNIVTAAMQYMLDRGVNQVTYQQLLTAPEQYLKPQTPVAGESYETIVVYRNKYSASVDVPGLGVISFSV